MNTTGVQRTGCTGLLARNLAVVQTHAITDAQIAGRTHVVGAVTALIELDRDAIALGVVTGVVAALNRVAGHGAGKPTSKIIEERADMLAFFAHTFQMSAP